MTWEYETTSTRPSPVKSAKTGLTSAGCRDGTTFSSTVARRVVPIDLDSRMENPEDRHGFRHPRLIEHVRQRRGECFTAALTVLKGFIQAGRPTHGGPRMGSFEAWDDLVRSATMWATDIDPASALDVLSGRGRVRDQADLDRERTAELLDRRQTWAYRQSQIQPRGVSDRAVAAAVAARIPGAVTLRGSSMGASSSSSSSA